MTIQPQYGYFVALSHPKLFGIVANEIAPQDYLPLKRSGQIEAFAAKNPDKLVMVPIHESEQHGDMPYPIAPSEEGHPRYLRIWGNPLDLGNPEKMVLIRETEYDIDGEKVIVPDRMMVGPKAPVYAMMKMTCCAEDHCKQAPFGVVPCYSQDGKLFGKLREPEAGVLENRPQMFADGIRLLRPEDMAIVKDLAVHAYAHATKTQLPSHDCHHGHSNADNVELGGDDLQHLRM